MDTNQDATPLFHWLFNENTEMNISDAVGMSACFKKNGKTVKQTAERKEKKIVSFFFPNADIKPELQKISCVCLCDGVCLTMWKRVFLLWSVRVRGMECVWERDGDGVF